MIETILEFTLIMLKWCFVALVVVRILEWLVARWVIRGPITRCVRCGDFEWKSKCTKYTIIGRDGPIAYTHQVCPKLQQS